MNTDIPDIEALITLLKEEEGGRKTPVSSGYHPAHLVKKDYLTTGIINITTEIMFYQGNLC